MKKRNESIGLINILLRSLALAWKTGPAYAIIRIVSETLMAVVPVALSTICAAMIGGLTSIDSELTISVSVLLIVFMLIQALSVMIGNLGRYCSVIHSDLLVEKMHLILEEKNLSIGIEHFDSPERIDMMHAAQKYIYSVISIAYAGFRGISSLIGAIVAFVYLADLNVLCALAIVVASTPQLIISQKMAKESHEWQMSHMSQERMKNYIFALSSQKGFAFDSRLFNIGDYILKKYLSIWNSIFASKKCLEKRKFIFHICSELIPCIAMGVLLYMVICGVRQGDIVPSSLILYYGLSSALASSVVYFGDAAMQVYDEKLKASVLYKYLDIESHENVEGGVFIDGIESIEFRRVWFKYPGTEKNVIKNLSFKVHKGEHVSLIGKNGSGKSTIVKLLIRLYDIDEGEILINGIDIQHININSLRSAFSVLFQESVLTAFSAKENIELSDRSRWNTEHSIEAIKSVLASIGARDVIEKVGEDLSRGLSRQFPDGTELSGGEQKKILIARTLCRNCDALILDEPTNSIHEQSVADLRQVLSALATEKMIIIITHDMNVAKWADRIMKLEDGRICDTINQTM